MPDGYELVGGTPVTVEPLEVSENGTYQQPRGKAYNPVKVNVSGAGGGAFYATYTEEIDPDSEESTWTCDKTLAEIATAYTNGQAVFAIMAVGGGESILPLDTVIRDEVTLEINRVFFSYNYLAKLDENTVEMDTSNIEHYLESDAEVIEVTGFSATFDVTFDE